MRVNSWLGGVLVVTVGVACYIAGQRSVRMPRPLSPAAAPTILHSSDDAIPPELRECVFHEMRSMSASASDPISSREFFHAKERAVMKCAALQRKRPPKA